MPELPEVETIRKSLSDHIVGKTIKEVEIFSAKQFAGDPKKIIGKKITDIERTGKIISIELSHGLFLSIHLKLSGQLLFSPNREKAVYKHKIPFVSGYGLPAKTTRIIIDFTDGSALFFNDLRKFGWIKLVNEPERPKAIDVLSKDFTEKYLKNITKRSGKPIKLLIMDQDKMAGVGNIYANDALSVAKVSPLRKSSTLSADENHRLYLGIKKVIEDGLKYSGASAGDEAYVLPDAGRGNYQNHARVYDREGKPCPNNCGGTVKRTKQGGRSSYFCPNCQI